jgi:Na+/H+ antiporter NhaD/arsenite permease-like protein
MAKMSLHDTAVMYEARMVRRVFSLGAFLCLAIFLPEPAFAAAGVEGRGMSLLWGLPFLGMLLSIALGPLLFAQFWHHHYGKIAFFWAASTLVPLALVFGPSAAFQSFLHAMLLEYMSFIILLFALFTVAGGIFVQGNIHGSPVTNLGILSLGAVLASFIGTTGASMVLIRPIIRANDDRKHNVHVVIFFIFIVSNIGGALTPLGDPPLFVGFLRGVDFFWTTQNLFFETLMVAGIVLTVFFLLDRWLYKKEGIVEPDPTPDSGIVIKGLAQNLPLIGLIIGAILMSAYWKPGIVFSVYGVEVQLQNLVRDALLLAVAFMSLVITHKPYREANGFNWEPILEVARLFFGIFICIIPVLAILAAGRGGGAAPLVEAITQANGRPDNTAYFWLTGALSSFLDNVPTYLVFFELAGGNAQGLMGHVPGKEYLATTLMAISTGAVYMGANTYIGNAPNFMVYAIAKDMGVKMPSFFGYMLWSGAVLIPTFLLCSFVFFR